MTIESAPFVNQLNAINPTGVDFKSEGDDHLRLVKGAILGSFPNVGGAVGAGHADLAAGANGSFTPGSTWQLCPFPPGCFLYKNPNGICQLHVSAQAVAGSSRANILTLAAGFRPVAALKTLGMYVKLDLNLFYAAQFSIQTNGQLALLRILDQSSSMGDPAAANEWLRVDVSYPTR